MKQAIISAIAIALICFTTTLASADKKQEEQKKQKVEQKKEQPKPKEASKKPESKPKPAVKKKPPVGKWSDAISLFDGKTFDGWGNTKGEAPKKGWVIENGTLFRKDGGAGQLYSKEEYEDFEFTFSWKISKKGNSGVKYRVAYYEIATHNRPGWIGCEYQLLDDQKSKPGAYNTAAVYALQAPNKKIMKAKKPAGEWNQSKIQVLGGTIKHWLNGELVNEINIDDEAWEKKVSKSKFAKTKPDQFPSPKGKIMLQDHGKQVWFKDLSIKKWEPKK